VDGKADMVLLLIPSIPKNLSRKLCENEDAFDVAVDYLILNVSKRRP